MKKQKKQNELRGMLMDLGKNAWFAGLGALSKVEKEGRRFYTDLVDYGKETKDRDETFIEKSIDFAGKRAKTVRDKVESGFKSVTRGTLNRAGVPSHEQIEHLIDRVDELNKRLEKKLEA